ncbi:MAG: hypothetical protein FWG73_02200 [Planctomycetaceae bacterium]|nr:hypothetical protein [Planctomycetaceae bacterium]
MKHIIGILLAFCITAPAYGRMPTAIFFSVSGKPARRQGGLPHNSPPK